MSKRTTVDVETQAIIQELRQQLASTGNHPIELGKWVTQEQWDTAQEELSSLWLQLQSSQQRIKELEAEIARLRDVRERGIKSGYLVKQGKNE